MLKLQYFGHRMGSSVSLEKALTLGKIEDRKRRGLLDGIIDSKDMSLGKLQETVKDQEAGMLQSMGSKRVGYDCQLHNDNLDVFFKNAAHRKAFLEYVVVSILISIS